jgi:hypothetical protein
VTQQTWLHFVGSKYYTIDSFIEESKKLGVTRRVSPQIARRMSYGDRVLLAMKQGKTPVVFGYFTIDMLTGISGDTMDRLWDCGLTAEDLGLGGKMVTKGCGTYILGATFTVDCDMATIMAKLEGLTAAEIGKLMVGGTFHVHPYARLKDVPFRQGYRLFDYDSFLAEALRELMRITDMGKSNRLPVVHGQFYADDIAAPEGGDGGMVQEVVDYKRLEEIQKIMQGKLELAR